MKACLIHEYGEMDKVRVEEIPDPGPGRWEALIEVKAASLNHLDVWVRKGRPGPSLSMPHVLGSDAAGVVRELGPEVHGIAVGDEVLLNPGLSCGCCEFCLRGEQSECVHFGIVGFTRTGVYSELAVVPAASLRRKPPYLTFEEASCLGIAYQTAWRMLFTRAGVRPGETVLIHGIGGGAALAALQFARIAGAEAIVTSSSDEKLSRAAELGASHPILYTEDDIVKEVMEATGGRGVDVAFDAVGAATWPLDFACVRKGGRIVLCGITTGAKAETDLQALYWNQITVLGSTMGSQEDFRAMLRTVEANDLRPVIDSVYPLDRAPKAMEKMEKGLQFGKIVLGMV